MKTLFKLAIALTALSSPEAHAKTSGDFTTSDQGLRLTADVKVLVGKTSSAQLHTRELLNLKQTQCLDLQFEELKAALHASKGRAADFLKQIFKARQIRVQLTDNSGCTAPTASQPHHLAKGAPGPTGTRNIELAFTLPAEAASCSNTVLTRAEIMKTVDEWAEASGVETVTTTAPCKVESDKGLVKDVPPKPKDAGERGTPAATGHVVR